MMKYGDSEEYGNGMRGVARARSTRVNSTKQNKGCSWISVGTGISSQIGTKLRDWAVGQAGADCYSRAALPSNDSKTLYGNQFVGRP